MLSKFLAHIPTRWRYRLAYGISFLALLLIGIFEMLEKHAKRLKFFLKQLKPVAWIGLVVIVLAFLSITLRSPGSESEVIAYSLDTPSEIKPDNSYKWLGGQDDPRKISLPSIQTEGFIQKVGRDQHGQIAVPNNIHIAGWFVDSVQPGQPGLSVIDGHVDGRSAQGGIFKQLEDLREGDEFQIELGSGKVLNYSVRTVDHIPTELAAGKLFNQDPTVSSQLNLITCGGTFNTETRDYSERVIVASEFIGN